MNFSEYKLEEAGTILCQPCLCFAFFSSSKMKQTPPLNLVGPYLEFVREFGDSVTRCRIGGDQTHTSPIKPGDIDAWPNWLSDEKRRSRGGYSVELRSGRSQDEWISPCLEVENSKIGEENTYYRICLPLEWLERKGANGVERYIDRSLKDFSLQSGYVGYSFAWDMSSPRALDTTEVYFNGWLQRHPGIMAPSAGSQSNASPNSLTDIGWITLLGPDFTAQVGGMDRLRTSVEKIPGIAIKDVAQGGAMIRIGDAPRLGDMTGNDLMEDYRETGNALTALRDRSVMQKNMVIHGLKRKHYPIEREKWIDRFF